MVDVGLSVEEYAFMVLSFFHEMGSKTVRSCRSPPPVFGRTEQTNVKFHAQFLAVCSSSILAETLGYAASFSSPWRGKRRVVERRKSLFMDQLQLSTNSDKLSDIFYQRQKTDTVGESPSGFEKYFFLRKFSTLFC